MNNKLDKHGRFGISAKAVREVINAMPKGEHFTGWELKEKCVALYPELKNMYVDTFLREMREYCKSQYQLVSRSESLYEKSTEAELPKAQSERQKEFEKYKTLRQQSFDFMEM